MALSVAITVREQSAQRMGQEPESDRKWGWAMKEGPSLLRRQIRYRLQVKGNRFLKRVEDFFEGAALDRDVEIEADRLPVAVSAFGVAAETSRRQF